MVDQIRCRRRKAPTVGVGKAAELPSPGTGWPVCIRFADPRDREQVQAYFCSLSAQARYNRFLGGMSKLPESVIEHFVRRACTDQFTMLATTMHDGSEIVVGEARYVLDQDRSRAELALSVHDRWQGRGIGRSLVKQLERHAMASGVRRIFVEMLESNARICRYARAFGYAPASSVDWRLVCFEKTLAV